MLRKTVPNVRKFLKTFSHHFKYKRESEETIPLEVKCSKLDHWNGLNSSDTFPHLPYTCPAHTGNPRATR
jgi:hypothetical protein